MKKIKKEILGRRKCSICNQSITFTQFSQLFIKLFKNNNKVECFLNTIDKCVDYIFNKGFDLKKYWKKQKNPVYCLDCLYDFYDAIHYHRQCFRCNKEMYFMEAFSARDNRDISREVLLAYWLDPIIEFYCCKCFKMHKN